MKMTDLSSLILLLLLTMQSFAQTAGKTVECKACPEIKALEQKISGLNFSHESDNQRGFDMLESVYVKFDEFQKRESQPEAEEEFKHLVALAAAAAPYDPESAVSDQISTAIYRQPNLGAAYKSMLKAMPKSCHKQLLEETVSAHTCLRDVVGQKQKSGTLSDGAGCPSSKFSFEKCFAKTKKGAIKK